MDWQQANRYQRMLDEANETLERAQKFAEGWAQDTPELLVLALQNGRHQLTREDLNRLIALAEDGLASRTEAPLRGGH